jgi:hypothetical protein
VISPTQRPLPDNTQHSQETDIHVPCWIRTHNSSMRAAVDPRQGKTIRVIKLREDEVDRACGTYEVDENYIQALGGKAWSKYTIWKI